MASLDVDLKTYLHEHRDEFVGKMVNRFYEKHPDLAEKYGDVGRMHCEKDAQYHLTYLEEALDLKEPILWTDYIVWAQSLLQERNMDVDHLKQYLNIMDDLFAQVLSHEARALVKDYIDQGLTRLDQPSEFSVSYIKPSNPLGDLTQKYTDCLIQGDRQQASKLILDAYGSGVSIPDLYKYVFQVSQYEIGRQWQMNCLSIAQEHYVTAATQFIMSQLYEHIFFFRQKRQWVAFCWGVCG